MEELPPKDELERRKLRAEIKLLDAKHDSEQKSGARLQVWIPLITVLCTVVTVGIQSCQYLSQQRHLYEVQIDQGLLTLAKGLSDSNSQPEEREQAALLLAAYESEAIPILLTHLRSTDEPTAVIESLRLVQGKRRVGAKAVSRHLVERAEVVFSTYDPQAGPKPYINYIRALRELAQTESERVVELLSTLQQKVADAQPTEADAALIKEEISQTCRALLGKECPEEGA